MGSLESPGHFLLSSLNSVCTEESLGLRGSLWAHRKLFQLASQGFELGKEKGFAEEKRWAPGSASDRALVFAFAGVCHLVPTQQEEDRVPPEPMWRSASLSVEAVCFHPSRQR